jgi:hypothetical protein
MIDYYEKRKEWRIEAPITRSFIEELLAQGEPVFLEKNNVVTTYKNKHYCLDLGLASFMVSGVGMSTEFEYKDIKYITRRNKSYYKALIFSLDGGNVEFMLGGE